MEVQTVTTTEGKVIPVSILHGTLRSLAKKMGKEVSTIFTWKMRGHLEVVNICGQEFIIDPGPNFKPERLNAVKKKGGQ